MQFKNFVFIFFIFILNCQSPVEKQKKITPSTSATVSEQEDINHTLDEIQTLADQLNLNQDFKNFPVVVLVEDSLRRKAQAYCEYKSSGGGQYIAIMRSTMAEYQLLYKPHGQNSFLFMLLVHEFGHCFYGRSHSDNITQNSVGENVPLSAMLTTSPNLLGMKNIPSSKRLYYLSEIAGIVTSQNFPVLD
jgi:hypothetical protein